MKSLEDRAKEAYFEAVAEQQQVMSDRVANRRIKLAQLRTEALRSLLNRKDLPAIEPGQERVEVEGLTFGFDGLGDSEYAYLALPCPLCHRAEIRSEQLISLVTVGKFLANPPPCCKECTP